MIAWMPPSYGAVASAALLAISCLPNDTRPPPGKVLVTASPDDALTDGATTADGWALAFERFLVSVGHVSVEGDSCIGYSDPDYSRVLDLRRPGPQKVSLVYAHGHCDFDFELSSPHADSVLGEGITEADKTFLRTPGSDPFVTGSGVSIFIAGKAAKEGVEKTFAWSYRHRIDYAECGSNVGGTVVLGFDIGQSESKSLDLLVRARALFEDGFDPALAVLRFQPLADADTVLGNADGVVTLDELALSPLAGIRVDGLYSGPEGGVEGWTTLADFVYLGAFPRVVRFLGNGTCDMEIFPNDRTPR